MMKFSKAYRFQLSEKLMDLGNLSAGALILGQFISDKEFSATLFATGIIVMFLLYTMSYRISRERRR